MDKPTLEYAKAIWALYGELDGHFDDAALRGSNWPEDQAAYYCWQLLKRVLADARGSAEEVLREA